MELLNHGLEPNSCKLKA
uniref:Uncharacterized protein n=1 Tax=Rhizophora mucronata TaxID=61149 RepID=A0A2P2M652_RHIMU